MTLGATESITNQAATRDPKTGSSRNADLAARWAESRAAYPFYAALATQLGISQSPYAATEGPPVRPTRSIFNRDLKWLDDIDERVLAYQIRQLPSSALNAGEETLRAVIQRQLRKPDKSASDRDKIDLLLVQYFALRAPEELYRGEISFADVARVLRPILLGAEASPLAWCDTLETILLQLEKCRSLRDLMEGGLLEQGRLLKDSAGCGFYDPAALVAFCRFNFLLRRSFIWLLHADLKAVRETIEALEAKGVKTVDCRRAGLSAAETTAQLRFFCENWRQPFQKDYTESSVNRAFEQLLALRADLEDALGKQDVSTRSQQWLKSDDAAGAGSTIVRQPNHSAGTPATNHLSRIGIVEADKHLKLIRKQLMDVPPFPSHCMATIVLDDTKILLSSWEIAAFVNDGNKESEDLRRAVVARSLLAVAMDDRKRSGAQCSLTSALAHARTEVSYVQGRVEAAKHAQKAESAVNLGISTKRLLSFIEEAEQLLP